MPGMPEVQRRTVEPAARHGSAAVAVRAAFAAAVIIAAAAFAVHHAVAGVRGGGNAYQAGDWLINYSAGFVRRGLIGEVLLTLAPSGEVALWLVFAGQVACYLLIVCYMAHYLIRERFSWAAIALVCSPAALGFIGWDPQGGFRKEILVFVTLVLLALARRTYRQVPTLILAGSAAAVYAVAVLSWEGSAFLIPAILFLLSGDRPTGTRHGAGVLAAVFTVITALGVLLAVVNRGSPATADAICDSLRDSGLDRPRLCVGAVDAVGWTLERNISDVLGSFPLYFGYLPLIALAAVPVVASRWFARNWQWAVAIALGVLPLYVIAFDWGRWTHLLAMSLAICIMAGRPGDAFSRVWTPLSTVLYVTLWGIPHWLRNDASWPPLGLLARVLELMSG